MERPPQKVALPQPWTHTVNYDLNLPVLSVSRLTDSDIERLAEAIADKLKHRSLFDVSDNDIQKYCPELKER